MGEINKWLQGMMEINITLRRLYEDPEGTCYLFILLHTYVIVLRSGVARVSNARGQCLDRRPPPPVW